MSVNSVDFEPSLIADRTYTSRQLPTKVDVAATLSFMVGLLYIIPGQAIVPNLTGAGRPALLVALLLWCWWLMVRLNPWLTMVGPQPLRWAALVYLLSLLLSYLAGLMRGLPSLESNAENLAVLQCFEFLGILLTAADGIPNWQRLKGVLRVFVWCAGFMALIGIVQSVLKYDPTPHLVLPGLTLKGEIDSLHPRGTGGLYRVAGTASHFIEFSAVMAMAVPFAIHFARFATKRWQRRLAVAVAVGCGAAVPISISRTGIVALAAAIVVMFPVWHWRLRYTFLVLGAGLTAALSVVRPGLIGTVSAMFTGLNEDPSIQGRTDDYTRVGQWFNERPW